MGIGLLHGLAGGSHLFGMLPAFAFATVVESVSYLLFFGTGTIVAMTGFSALIGIMSGRVFTGQTGYTCLMGGLSASAVMIGAIWLLI